MKKLFILMLLVIALTACQKQVQNNNYTDSSEDVRITINVIPKEAQIIINDEFDIWKGRGKLTTAPVTKGKKLYYEIYFDGYETIIGEILADTNPVNIELVKSTKNN